MSQLKVAANDNMEAAQVAKANHAISDLWKKWKVYDDPINVVCDKIIVDSNNRGGQPPDMQYLHCNLEPQQERDGFDDKRPRPGLLKLLNTHTLEKKKLITTTH